MRQGSVDDCASRGRLTAAYFTGALGYAHARSGRRREAEQLLDTLLHSSGTQSNSALAFIYTGMDDKERALEMLEKGLQERENFMTHLKVERYSTTSDPSSDFRNCGGGCIWITNFKYQIL